MWHQNYPCAPKCWAPPSGASCWWLNIPLITCQSSQYDRCHNLTNNSQSRAKMPSRLWVKKKLCTPYLENDRDGERRDMRRLECFRLLVNKQQQKRCHLKDWKFSSNKGIILSIFTLSMWASRGCWLMLKWSYFRKRAPCTWFFLFFQSSIFFFFIWFSISEPKEGPCRETNFFFFLIETHLYHSISSLSWQKTNTQTPTADFIKPKCA